MIFDKYTGYKSSIYIHINPYPTIFITNPISPMFDLNYKHTLEIYFLPPMHDMKETKTK